MADVTLPASRLAKLFKRAQAHISAVRVQDLHSVLVEMKCESGETLNVQVSRQPTYVEQSALALPESRE